MRTATSSPGRTHRGSTRDANRSDRPPRPAARWSRARSDRTPRRRRAAARRPSRPPPSRDPPRPASGQSPAPPRTRQSPRRTATPRPPAAIRWPSACPPTSGASVSRSRQRCPSRRVTAPENGRSGTSTSEPPRRLTKCSRRCTSAAVNASGEPTMTTRARSSWASSRLSAAGAASALTCGATSVRAVTVMRGSSISARRTNVAPHDGRRSCTMTDQRASPTSTTACPWLSSVVCSSLRVAARLGLQRPRAGCEWPPGNPDLGLGSGRSTCASPRRRRRPASSRRTRVSTALKSITAQLHAAQCLPRPSAWPMRSPREPRRSARACRRR